MHAVTAGGRRLKALQELAAEGVIAADFKVPCLIEQPDEALETSLMENTIRAAMHPADEFVAMAALIDAGETIEAVAVRFGASERHVRQRLRLGKLAPELLDAFRAGKIGLEVVTAFTLGADHAAQLAVWRQVKDRSYIQPYTVRHLLTETAVALDSDLGAFVGAEALRGRRRHGHARSVQRRRRGLPERCRARAPARDREARSEGRGIASRNGRGPRRCSIPNTASWRSTRACARSRPRFLPELAEEIERIERRLGELEEEIGEDDWTDELRPKRRSFEERRGEIDEIIDGLAVYTEEDRRRAGCIVTIGDDGEFCLHQGLVERAARTRRGRQPRSADAEDDGDEMLGRIG